jgi:amidase
MPIVTVEQSGAFIEQFSVLPTGDGPLDGLRFAVKDLIDVAGHRTGCGNPDWLATHPQATVSAVCVDQLLAAGAACDGKTITDEIAFSLLGENFFYGTPLNPAAPDRVPGGSSCGSASAVACGLVDFALGTDTGGSVRVPSSYCGLWGMRPSHGIVSLAGVMPFSPSFDTVGILAGYGDVLEKAMGVLLGAVPKSPAPPANVFIVDEPFALADPDVRQALAAPLERVRATYAGIVHGTSLQNLFADQRTIDLSTWVDAFRTVRGAEVMSCLGPWVDATKPTFGPAPAAGFDIIRQLDRSKVGEAIHMREQQFQQLRCALGPRDLLCLPTAPTLPPIKGTASHDRHGDFYTRTLALTSIAGNGRLPQVTMPLAEEAGVPVGLSFVGAHGEDLWLLKTACEFGKQRDV